MSGEMKGGEVDPDEVEPFPRQELARRVGNPPGGVDQDPAEAKELGGSRPSEDLVARAGAAEPPGKVAVCARRQRPHRKHDPVSELPSTHARTEKILGLGGVVGIDQEGAKARSPEPVPDGGRDREPLTAPDSLIRRRPLEGRVDPVLGGLDSRVQGGVDRPLEMVGRAREREPPAGFAELGERRHPPIGHEAIDQRRAEGVEDDDRHHQVTPSGTETATGRHSPPARADSRALSTTARAATPSPARANSVPPRPGSPRRTPPAGGPAR